VFPRKRDIACIRKQLRLVTDAPKEGLEAVRPNFGIPKRAVWSVNECLQESN